MNQFTSYAQNREDAVLDAYFRDVKKGFYIDIGAHHPIQESVTKNFYKRGWRGINVEPNPHFYNLQLSDRPEDTNVQSGISNKKGKLKLRIYENSGLSTFSDKLKDAYSKSASGDTTTYKDLDVPVTTLKALLSVYSPKHIHFMKIDVEGFEYEVLEGNNWEIYRPEMICIEANHIVHDWRPLLQKHDYEKVWNDGLNDYYLAKESANRKKNFSYAEDMLTERQVIPHHVIDKVTSLVDDAEYDKSENQALRMKTERLKEDNKELQEQVAKERRLRYAARNLVVGVDKAIIAQIERLGKRPANLSETARYHQTDYDFSSAENLLSTIQDADLKAYYSQKEAARPRKLIVYKTVKQTYFVPRHLVAMFFRAVLKLNKPRKSSS